MGANCPSNDLMKLLACPACNIDFSIHDTYIGCDSCGYRLTWDSGALCAPMAEPGSLPKFYDDPDYLGGRERLSDLHASHYDARSMTGKLEHYLKTQVLKLLSHAQRPYVDIGCGTGAAFDLLGYPAPVIGIDSNLDLLKRAKARYLDSDCLCCDPTDAPIRNNSIHVMFVIGTLEHIFYGPLIS